MLKHLFALILGLALMSAPALAEDPRLPKAESLYKQFCSHCHGLGMVNPGTSSYDLRKFPTDDRNRFVQAVTKGKGNMPAWGDVLLPDELDLLWFYVATRGGKEPEPAALAPSAPDAAQSAQLTTPGTLTACLARNGGVMSSRRAGGGVGLDYEVAAALAARMELALGVEWYQSEPDEESTPVREIHALLAHGVCDIVPGFALYETALSGTLMTRAALPRWDNRPATMDHAFQVDLEPVAASLPYARMEMGVVFRNADFARQLTRLTDLDGLRLGVEQGTLAGVLTLRQGTAAMAARAITLNPGPEFLWRMEQGAFDAALVTIGAYDFHKRQNTISTLVLGDYRHPIGFNLGIALLERNAAWLAEIDPALTAMVASGEMAALAAKSGVTYAAPREPHVLARLTMQDILSVR